MKVKEINDPSPELREAVCVHLRQHNQNESPAFWAARDLPANAPRPINLFAYDDRDEIIGGLFGTTEFAWLKIDIMAVEKERRGEKLGTALLTEAERIARERGCRYAFTDTMDFQAPSFYQHAGYQVSGEISDWDSHGHTKFFLTKSL